MYTDIRVQELYLARAEQEREKKAATTEMIRIATAGQPVLVTRLRAAVGTMLINVGEALRRQTSDLERDVAIGSGSRSIAR